MTNFIVRAIYGGTSKILAISASTPQVALAKVQRSRHCKEASAFIVYSRELGSIPVLTGKRWN